MRNGGKSDEFVVRVVDSMQSVDLAPREGIVPADLAVSAEESLAALHATKGSEKVFKTFPQFLDVSSWLPVANFTVCSKFGSARYLDLWDVDHFDGFTNLQKNLDDCRAWFSDKGFDTWGSGQTRSGRINCYFTAPQAGGYICTARLQSYAGAAVVECLIDNSSFGPLPVNGTITQPHPCNLSAGGHHFRIRQLSGSFFFLSLTVWRA
jgi:hypothetical protein